MIVLNFFCCFEHGDTVHEHSIDASGYCSLTVKSLMFLSFSSFTLPPLIKYFFKDLQEIFHLTFCVFDVVDGILQDLHFRQNSEGAILSNLLINFRLLIFLGSMSLP